MSVQLSKKKLAIFGIIVIVIILGVIETTANVWWSSIQDCAFEASEIYKDLSEEEKKKLCINLYQVRTTEVGLIPNPSESININSLGFRGNEFSPQKPENTYRIFLLGGSTMFGPGAATDNTTIPGFLQQIFDNKMFNQNVEVINAGFSGGNSEYEIKLIIEKISFYEPDLIVMYDGWNDLRAQYPVLRIVSAWNQTCNYGNDNGIDVVITLQPIAGFGNKILTEQEYINSLTGEDHNGHQFLSHKQSYDWLASELVNLENVCTKTADLRGVFDHVSNTIYFDQGHIGDEGNAIVAEKMFDILSPIVENDSKNLSFSNNIKIENQNLPIKSDKVSQAISFYKTPVMISYFLQNPTSGLNINKLDGKYYFLKQTGERIFVGADLSNEDLSKLDLSNNDLSGANLSGQDLSSIDLSGTILRSADLSFTNLSGQDLSGKDLIGTNFSNANLLNADLTGVKLGLTIQHVAPKKDMSGVDNLLLKTLLISSTASHFKTLTDFSKADLTGTKLDQVTFNFIDFSETNLKDATLNYCKMFGVILFKADLSEEDLSNCFFINVDFSKANLEDSNFANTRIYASNFNDANLKNSNFYNSEILRSNFVGANLEGAQIGGSVLECVNHPICN